MECRQWNVSYNAQISTRDFMDHLGNRHFKVPLRRSDSNVPRNLKMFHSGWFRLIPFPRDYTSWFTSHYFSDVLSAESWSTVCPPSTTGAPVVNSNQAKPKWYGSVPALNWTVWQTLMSLSTLVKLSSIPLTASATWAFCSTVYCLCISTLLRPCQLFFT